MSSEYIPYNEVIYQGLSFTDEYGRLFKWNGGLFRGIPSKRASFCRYLFNKGIMRELIEKKLFVETEITPLKIDHYEIVLRHRTIPFVAYPQEWCDMMLKDAALHHLEFCLELDNHNLKSDDAHPLNILFDGCQPIFVDFGSIDPIQPNNSYSAWSRYEQFCSVFIRPLRLMAQGHGRIAHWLLHDYEQGVLKSDLEALTQRFPRIIVNRLKSSARLYKLSTINDIINKVYLKGRHFVRESRGFRQPRRAFFEQIRQEVESIDLPSARPKVLEGSDSPVPISLPPDNCTSGNRFVSAVLSELRPGSVLDIGRGIHGVDNAMLAVRFASRVVAVNPDEAIVRKIYVFAKRRSLPILPLKINFFSPSYDLSNYWFTPASERLRCDLVLALDIIDHLVITENIRLDLIVERLYKLSNHWLLADFIPFENWQNCEIEAAQYSWYTLDHLIVELKKRFQSVKASSSRSNPRIFLLCEK